jgi:hypothetical protein
MATQFIANKRAPKAANGAVGIGVSAGGALEIRRLVAGVDTIQSGLSTGTSAAPESTATADTKFTAIYTKSTATSGDSRGIYLKHLFSGAGGSGDALRAWGVVDNVTAASGGTVTGAHISLSITGASGAISGQGAALRATLGASANTRTLNANISPLIVESDIATGNTLGAATAFIRVVNTGAVPITKFLRMPTVASGGILAAHVTDGMSHSIRCVDDAGTVFYLMATTTSSNRTGGA